MSTTSSAALRAWKTDHVAVFSCARCGAVLTPDLAHSPEKLVRPPAQEGRGPRPSTMPRGFFAIDPEPFGVPFVPAADQDPPVYDLPKAMPGGSTLEIDGVFFVSAGPRNTIVIHPDDAPSLQLHPDFTRRTGCCGLDGERGPNRVCRCGAEVATLMADCTGAHELHLDPSRVSSQAETRQFTSP
ncbi:hypothetical protein AB0L34_06660 [Micromonospora sp. NPDC052213]|uniref:hypothetical protein n=1 Tax=Micromonospora sp. NPDC052213 TaxID=3155812 RepID=UPI00341C4057